MRYMILIVAIIAGLAAWMLTRPNETLLHGTWDLDVDAALAGSTMPPDGQAMFRAANTGKTYIVINENTIVTAAQGVESSVAYKVKIHGDPCPILETASELYQYCVVGDTLREKVNGELGAIYRRRPAAG